jgi:predicted RNA-binding Zn-ribbon protein involved in translation (DUF1610 family)
MSEKPFPEKCPSCGHEEFTRSDEGLTADDGAWLVCLNCGIWFRFVGRTKDDLYVEEE